MRLLRRVLAGGAGARAKLAQAGPGGLRLSQRPGGGGETRPAAEWALRSRHVLHFKGEAWMLFKRKRREETSAPGAEQSVGRAEGAWEPLAGAHSSSGFSDTLFTSSDFP